MITIQTSVSKGWLFDEAGFSFEEQYYFDPTFRWKQDREIDKYLNDRFPDYAIYNMEANLVQAEFFKNEQVLVGGIQPNLILGACLGSEFVFFPDKDSDIVGKPLENITEINKLPDPGSIVENSFIKKLDSQIISIQKERPELTAIPPFFWDDSGRATIHGFITTSLKFFGEDIFIKIFDDLEFVKSLHSWITDVYTALIQHFSELGNIPVSLVHIGECSGSMLNAEQFENFVVPFASKMGENLGPIRFHTCGFSDHLLEPMSKIENLQVIDTGSNTSVAAMREIFGNEKELNIEPPIDILLAGTDSKDVIAWLENVLLENNGGPLKIVYHLESSYSLENTMKIHDELYTRGLINKGRKY